MTFLLGDDGLLSASSSHLKTNMDRTLKIALEANLMLLNKQDVIFQGAPNSTSISTLASIGYLLCELKGLEEGIGYHERARMMIEEKYNKQMICDEVVNSQNFMSSLYYAIGCSCKSKEYKNSAQSLKNRLSTMNPDDLPPKTNQGNI